MPVHNFTDKRFKKVTWSEVKADDEVFVQGKGLTIYGPHYVVDVNEVLLKNPKGRQFYERCGYLYVRI